MSNTTDDHAMEAPIGGAVVRMYCTGIGDCFLLGFPADDGKTSYMMIDCGSLKGTRRVSGRMKMIMNSIAQATKGRGIEILVATHKHWDHLSGFKQAEEEFNKLDIRQVWLGWTENRADERASQLALEEDRLAKSLHKAALKLNTFNNQEISNNIYELLAFEYGPDSDAMLGATSTNDLMDIVRKRVARPRYLEPSVTAEKVPGVSSVNAYVLGPPRDLSFLKKSNPSSGKKSEVYVVGTPESELSAFYTAAELLEKPHEELTDEEKRLRELTFPFDADYGMWVGDSLRHSDYSTFFRKHYGFKKGDEGPAWRRIDTDWLGIAEDLALQFDRFRNNTSVVLAIELGANGPVLLFPGDAQVGSWLSWDQLEGVPSAEDLLGRTVLYKVGHHGSHNATLKKRGLERMGLNRSLVAMVPVDEEMAREPKGKNTNGWDMPYAGLIDALMRKTQGRILRSDTGIPAKPDPDADIAEDDWRAFTKEDSKVVTDGRTGTPLFVQYTVRG